MKDKISYLIMSLYKDFIFKTNDILKKHNISFGQIGFIIFIGKHNGCTLKQIKEYLKADWGHCQRVIIKLIDQEFINKVVDKSDHRISHLYLTKLGEDAFKLSHDVFDIWDKEKIAKLTITEKDNLLTLLNKIKEDDSNEQL